MPVTNDTPELLVLVPVSGPQVPPVNLDRERPHLSLGRHRSNDVALHHDTISRQHAVLSYRFGTWFATDLASLHGTFVNDERLQAHRAVPLKGGDLIRLGPWTFRVADTESRLSAATTSNDPRTDIVDASAAATGTTHLEHHRLDLLLQFAAHMSVAPDEDALAARLLDTVFKGTGFPRGAILRNMGDDQQVGVVLASSNGAESVSGMMFSRSLIRAASEGRIVRKVAGASHDFESGESWNRLGIHSALCVPMGVGGSVASYLYLDSRGGERPIEKDAAVFCEALVRIYTLALSSLRRADLERRQRDFDAELKAGSEAQEVLFPTRTGEQSGLVWCVGREAGRLVVGDLFDVIPIDEHRAAVLIGDVTGKGVGASIRMASTQTQLRCVLEDTADPLKAVARANRSLAVQQNGPVPVSLWVGVIDSRQKMLTYVDAGHGYWLSMASNGRLTPAPLDGGIPLGIEPDFEYRAQQRPLSPGERVILFSDGLVDQRSPENAMFGMERIAASLLDSQSPIDDVSRLLQAVLHFAGTMALTDDMTVASIHLSGKAPAGR
jgi:serine phosphatase RsbU (regulator of sigma subunit)